MDTIYIMSFLQGVPTVGRQDLTVHAPHVTFLPKVDVQEYQIPDFIHNVEEVTKRTRTFSLPTGEEALFGVNEDIRVQQLEDTHSDGLALHLNLLASAFKAGASSSERTEYIGLNYHPHISLDSDRNKGFILGATVEISTVTVAVHKGGFGSNEVYVMKNLSLA